MKKFLLALCLFATPVWAQENLPPECRVIEEYASGGAEYQPGVDVHGKPVVPADVNATPMQMDSQVVVIPLSVDLAQRLQNQNISGIDMTSTLGFIEVGPGGRVTYNGQDLTPQIHVLCDEDPQKTAIPANGQAASDAVEYAPVKKKPEGAPVPKPVTPNYPKVDTPALKPPATPPVPEKAPEQGELIEGEEYR